MTLYDNVFINGSGDAIHIRSRNEAASHITLAYLPDPPNIAVSALSPPLRAQHPRITRLPQSLLDELAAYPGWRAAPAGANVSAALLRALETSWP
ncbi:MAG: hypothetical protein ACM3KD_13390 [Hyphomicrobiaceae bacterium]